MREIARHGEIQLYRGEKYPSTLYALYGKDGREILSVSVFEPIPFRVKNKPLARPSDDYVRQDALNRERIRAARNQ